MGTRGEVITFPAPSKSGRGDGAAVALWSPKRKGKEIDTAKHTGATMKNKTVLQIQKRRLLFGSGLLQNSWLGGKGENRNAGVETALGFLNGKGRESGERRLGGKRSKSPRTQ